MPMDHRAAFPRTAAHSYNQGPLLAARARYAALQSRDRRLSEGRVESYADADATWAAAEAAASQRALIDYSAAASTAASAESFRNALVDLSLERQHTAFEGVIHNHEDVAAALDRLRHERSAFYSDASRSLNTLRRALASERDASRAAIDKCEQRLERESSSLYSALDDARAAREATDRTIADRVGALERTINNPARGSATREVEEDAALSRLAASREISPGSPPGSRQRRRSREADTPQQPWAYGS